MDFEKDLINEIVDYTNYDKKSNFLKKLDDINDITYVKKIIRKFLDIIDINLRMKWTYDKKIITKINILIKFVENNINNDDLNNTYIIDDINYTTYLVKEYKNLYENYMKTTECFQKSSEDNKNNIYCQNKTDLIRIKYINNYNTYQNNNDINYEGLLFSLDNFYTKHLLKSNFNILVTFIKNLSKNPFIKDFIKKHNDLSSSCNIQKLKRNSFSAPKNENLALSKDSNNSNINTTLFRNKTTPTNKAPCNFAKFTGALNVTQNVTFINLNKQKNIKLPIISKFPQKI